MGQYKNAGPSLRTIPVRGENGKVTHHIMNPGEVKDFPDGQVKDLIRKGEFEAYRPRKGGEEQD